MDDTHIGGFPEAGLIVIGGNPGVGKTTNMVKFAASFAKEHTNKVVAVCSIEMLLMEVAGRFREISKLPEDIEKRIHIDDTPVTPEQANESRGFSAAPMTLVRRASPALSCRHRNVPD